MTATATKTSPTLEPAFCIRVIVPDDGTDLRLMKALLEEKGITRAHSVSLRAVGMLREARSKRGHLPESALARLVVTVAGESEAEALFAFICETAYLNRNGGGLASLQKLQGASIYALPRELPLDLPKETGHSTEPL
ncbi:hypothetical protein HXX02_05150 [Microbulbifer elongatus]|uniref:Uncharacterized protein n=1 Tax=Microbulbifer elongatus TaxID=86173 RepID=A0ABT1NY64_9GAMM|nr:hypothetical protein [Microbulbifer elongatus]MCQ3828821.1 hypothetical protein [Microbulbifer elongatus]